MGDAFEDFVPPTWVVNAKKPSLPRRNFRESSFSGEIQDQGIVAASLRKADEIAGGNRRGGVVAQGVEIDGVRGEHCAVEHGGDQARRVIHQREGLTDPGGMRSTSIRRSGVPKEKRGAIVSIARRS